MTTAPEGARNEDSLAMAIGGIPASIATDVIRIGRVRLPEAPPTAKGSAVRMVRGCKKPRNSNASTS